MKEIAALLLALGCNPEAKIIIDPHLPVPGYYRDGTMYLRLDATKQVIAHECKHSKQKKAINEREWELNEREAKRAELKGMDE